MNNKREWESLINKWRKSGLSQSEYCRKVGIRPNRFWYWRKKLEGSTTESKHDNQFISLIPESGESQIEICVGSVTVKVPLAVSNEKLEGIVRCLS